MAINERSRHDLYVRLEGLLGPEAATTLMEHLPPEGWAEVATKRDLDIHAAVMKRDLDAHATAWTRDLDAHAAAMTRDLGALAERMDHRFELVDQRFETMEYKLLATFRAELQSALTSQTRQLTLTLVGMTGTIGALAFAAAKLA